MEAVISDAGLQEKLKALTDADVVVEIAKEAGFSVSADDLTEVPSELSDEKLEGVAGGATPYFDTLWDWINNSNSTCTLLIINQNSIS